MRELMDYVKSIPVTDREPLKSDAKNTREQDGRESYARACSSIVFQEFKDMPLVSQRRVHMKIMDFIKEELININQE